MRGLVCGDAGFVELFLGMFSVGDVTDDCLDYGTPININTAKRDFRVE